MLWANHLLTHIVANLLAVFCFWALDGLNVRRIIALRPSPSQDPLVFACFESISGEVV